MQAGYYLKSVGAYSYSCQKLSQVFVHIYGEEDVLFPPVLLSLSGDKGYRNNTVTGVGGHYTFTDLFPGSFYLRPLLKVFICFTFNSLFYFSTYKYKFI